MDRDAHVRAARRRQALDALAFERDRGEMLTVELEDAIAGVDGERVDAAVFAQMSSEDVGLVRAALGDDPAVVGDEDDDYVEHSFESDGDGLELEEEIARLEGELTSSRRVQAALERYLEVLSDRPSAP